MNKENILAKLNWFYSLELSQVAGALTGALGPELFLKADIALEEKAMKDYKDFILRVGGDPKLFNVLWSNLIDEDLHSAWFSNKLKELGK